MRAEEYCILSVKKVIQPDLVDSTWLQNFSRNACGPLWPLNFFFTLQKRIIFVWFQRRISKIFKRIFPLLYRLYNNEYPSEKITKIFISVHL